MADVHEDRHALPDVAMPGRFEARPRDERGWTGVASTLRTRFALVSQLERIKPQTSAQAARVPEVPMRICVTGGAGFIGSHLVDRLVRSGHDVTVLDNLSTGDLSNLRDSQGEFSFVEGDLRDPTAVTRAVRGTEVVFHQAAMASVGRSVRTPLVVNEVNVTGLLNVLVAARDTGAKRIVFASSSSVYGDTPTLPKCESMSLTPRSPYAATKAAGEDYLAAFHGAYGLEGVALRYFNVYGPRQSPDSEYAAVIPLFVDAFAKGIAPTIFGDGRQTRDFTFVHDVVDANCRAAFSAGPVSGAFNVGAGKRTSITDLAKAVGQAMGTYLTPTHEETRTGDVKDSLADISRAASLLGWRPRTPLATGLEQVADAYRCEQQVSGLLARLG